MADCTALALHPWEPVQQRVQPLGHLPMCVDAAQGRWGYQIGLLLPNSLARVLLAPPEIHSQQEAELFAIDAATRLAVRLGMKDLTIIGDNMGALYM